MMDYKSFRNVIKTWIHCRSPWSQLTQTRTGLMGLRGDVSKGDVVSILLRVRDILQRASWTCRWWNTSPWISPKKASTWFRISAINNSIFYLKFFHVFISDPQLPENDHFSSHQAKNKKTQKFQALGEPLAFGPCSLVPTCWSSPGGTCRESLEETNGKLPSELSTSQP